MRASLLLIAALCLASFGFALIAFSQKQHWPLLRREGSQPPGWFKPLGGLLIGLAILPAVVRDGIAFGLLLWASLLTAAACLVISWIVLLNRRLRDRDPS